MKRAVVFAGTVVGGLAMWGASAFAATSGPQGFVIHAHNNQQPHVSAAGPIHGAGRDLVQGPNHDTFVFPNGSVGVNHQPTAQHNGPTVGCVSFFSERGTYQLTGGTGQYTGATGAGHYRVNGVSFGTPTHNGGCTDSGGTQMYNVFAHGHTTLPR